MTTKNAEVSEHSLINLIYHHLKDNGHEKAANALKKRAPQVETTSGKVSLNDIFKKWVTNKRGKTSGADILEAKVSKPKTRKAGHSANSNKNDKSQKRKRSVKKNKSSLSEAPTEAIPDLASISLRGEDSDSDSSLDVEKWKRLALEISDADIGKLDSFANFSLTATSSQEKPTKKRKPAQTKKDSSQNMKTKKTKSKTVIGPSKTDKMGTPLKPSIKKKNRNFEKMKNTIPSKKLKDKGNFSECIKVETTEVNFAEGVSGQIFNHKREKAMEHLTDRIKTPNKKVKHKNAQNLLESSNTETTVSQKPKEVDTPRKKAKSKKSVKCAEPLNVDIPSEGDEKITCNHKASKKSKKKDNLHSLLNPNPTETPSKKSSKLMKSSQCTEPVDLKTLLKECETEIATRLLTSDQLETTLKSVESVNYTEVKTPPMANVCKQLKAAKKSKKPRASPEPADVNSPSEGQTSPDLLQTPSKRAKAKKNKHVVEPDPAEVPRKKSKVKKTYTCSELIGDESQKMEASTAVSISIPSELPSKKDKHHMANSFSESVISETPSKKCKTKKATKVDNLRLSPKNTSVDVGGEGSKKTAHSKSDNKESASNIISDYQGKNETSVLKSAIVSVKHNTELQDTYCPQTQSQDRKKKKESKDEENTKASDLEEGPTNPKKRKKHKEKKEKEAEGSVAEDLLPPTEDFTDNLAHSPNKKKKKKKKFSDEEQPLGSPSS